VVNRARYYGSSAERALLHLFRCHRHNVLGNNVGRHHIKVLVEVLIAAPLNFIDVIQ